MQINKNFIVDNGHGLPNDKDEYFPEEEVIFISEKADMFDVLVVAGIYKTKMEARAEWTGSRIIPKGFNLYRNIGRDHHMLAILNP